MKRRAHLPLLSALTFIVLIVAFQNCTGGFKVDPQTGELHAASTDDPAANAPSPVPTNPVPVTGVDPAATPFPLVVTLKIPSGTGNKSWNSLNTPARVFVGQTLRIVNDDTIPHRMHTGGAPCGHQPANTQPGDFFDCVAARPLSAAAGATYDHNAGVNAKAYINAYDGGALYAQKCASCHNPLATSKVKNARAGQIRKGMTDFPQMHPFSVTEDEIEAIAFALSR